jgi:hypothetical protein
MLPLSKKVQELVSDSAIVNEGRTLEIDDTLLGPMLQKIDLKSLTAAMHISERVLIDVTSLMRTRQCLVVKFIDWEYVVQSLLAVPAHLCRKFELTISGFRTYPGIISRFFTPLA